MRRLIPVFAFLAFSAPFIVCAQDPFDTPQRQWGQYRHDGLIKISFDPQLMLTKQALQELASSDIVLKHAVRDVNGKPLADRLEQENHFGVGDERLVAEMGLSFTDDSQVQDGTIYGTLHTFARRRPREKEPDIHPKAKEFQDLTRRYHEAVRKRLEDALNQLSRREIEKRLARQRQLLEDNRKSAEIERSRLNDKRQDLRGISSGLPQSVLEESVSNLQQQQQALELEIAGFKGRTAALERQIAKATEELKQQPADDEVTQNLKRVLELRKRTLGRMRALRESGTVTEVEMAKQEEQVALAEVELAQAKRQGANSVRARLDALNAELEKIAVERADAETKLEYVTKHLGDALQELKTEIDRAQPLRDEITAEAAIAQQMAAEVRQAEAELRRLEASFRPASVEVFEFGETADAPSK